MLDRDHRGGGRLVVAGPGGDVQMQQGPFPARSAGSVLAGGGSLEGDGLDERMVVARARSRGRRSSTPRRTTDPSPERCRRMPGRTASGRSFRQQRSGRRRGVGYDEREPPPVRRMCSTMASVDPVELITQTSPFCSLRAAAAGEGRVGDERLEHLGGHVSVGTEHGGLPCHPPHQHDRRIPVPFGQLVDRLDRDDQGLGQRLHRLAAPDVGLLRIRCGRYRASRGIRSTARARPLVDNGRRRSSPL